MKPLQVGPCLYTQLDRGQVAVRTGLVKLQPAITGRETPVKSRLWTSLLALTQAQRSPSHPATPNELCIQTSSTNTGDDGELPRLVVAVRLRGAKAHCPWGEVYM